MAWLPTVSLADLGNFADAVNKISESVKSIETSFDSSFGFQDTAATSTTSATPTPISQPSDTATTTVSETSPDTSVLTASAAAKSEDTATSAAEILAAKPVTTEAAASTLSSHEKGTVDAATSLEAEGDAGERIVAESAVKEDLNRKEDGKGENERGESEENGVLPVDQEREASNVTEDLLNREEEGASNAVDHGENHPLGESATSVGTAGRGEVDLTNAGDEKLGAESLPNSQLESDSLIVADAAKGIRSAKVTEEAHKENLVLKNVEIAVAKGTEQEETKRDSDEILASENVSHPSKSQDAEVNVESARDDEAGSFLGHTTTVDEVISETNLSLEQTDYLEPHAESSKPVEMEKQTVGEQRENLDAGDQVVHSIRTTVVADSGSVEENEKLRLELEQMEISLQAAARQAQNKADELARFMALNDELKCKVEELRVKVAESKEDSKKSSEAELDALREEYQHRLSAAERKVYALTKERDMMRREQSRKSDTSALLKEKDEIIKQVMAEGEELSKKQAAQELLMKKLRSQIRELEDEKQRLTSRVQVEEARGESMKKDKAQTEKALQEAVERGQTELAAQKEFYVAALAEAKEAQIQAEARADSEAKADLDKKLREAADRERMLIGTVDELRQALSRTEQQAAFREDLLRRDLDDLQKRCQAAESRHEELMARMPDSTRPLLRQIQAMQESANMRVEALAGVEQALTNRLQDAEAKAAVAEERERASTERLTQTLSRMSVMEAQLALLRSEQAQLVRSLDKERVRAGESRQEYLAAMESAATHEGRARQLEEELRELRARHRREMADERARREAFEQEMEIERTAMAEYEKRIRAEGRAAAEKAVAVAHGSGMADSPAGRMMRQSSNASGGSADESSILAATLSVNSGDNFGPFSPFAGHRQGFLPAATMEQVEAMMRHKDGELGAYSARVAALEATRDSLAEELVSTTQQCEHFRNESLSLPSLKAELVALRRRHASALELMGERDEQVEELKADLADVKQMYREQIDLLVNQIERVSKEGVLLNK